jgi:hypothetical protein
MLMVGGAAVLLLRLANRQVEVWEDDFLDKHGTNCLANSFALSIGFMSRHPLWAMLIFAGCVLLGMIVHAYIATHPFLDFEKGEAQGQQKSPRDTSKFDLPEVRPCVAPHSYGSFQGEQGHGLIVTNPGYAAFNVHIPAVAIGASQYKLVFPLKMTQMSERDHKCFFPAWLEHPDLPGRSGKDLDEIMRTNNVDKFNLSIVYQDSDFHWYRSGCLVERDVGVTGGIAVSFVQQKVIPDPTHTSSSEVQPGFSVRSEVIKFRHPEKGTDPMIYLSISNDDELFQRTRLILHNSGGGVAHNVRIQELKVGHELVKFGSLAILGVDEKQDVLPVIEDGPFSKHNLLAILNKDWSTNGGPFTGEYPFDLAVEYEDFKHQGFRTLVAMMYYPVKESYARNHAHDSPIYGVQQIILEVKNIELRRLS